MNERSVRLCATSPVKEKGVIFFLLIVLKAALDRLTSIPDLVFWQEPSGCSMKALFWTVLQWYGVNRAYFSYLFVFCCFCFWPIIDPFFQQRRPVQLRRTPPEPLWDTETPLRPTAAYCPIRWRGWAGSLQSAAFPSQRKFSFFCWTYQRWQSGSSNRCASSILLMVRNVCGQ